MESRKISAFAYKRIEHNILTPGMLQLLRRLRMERFTTPKIPSYSTASPRNLEISRLSTNWVSPSKRGRSSRFLVITEQERQLLSSCWQECWLQVQEMQQSMETNSQTTSMLCSKTLVSANSSMFSLTNWQWSSILNLCASWKISLEFKLQNLLQKPYLLWCSLNIKWKKLRNSQEEWRESFHLPWLLSQNQRSSSLTSQPVASMLSLEDKPGNLSKESKLEDPSLWVPSILKRQMSLLTEFVLWPKGNSLLLIDQNRSKHNLELAINSL